MDAETRRQMVLSNCCPLCGGDLSVRVPRKVKVCGQVGACGRLWSVETGEEIRRPDGQEVLRLIARAVPSDTPMLGFSMELRGDAREITWTKDFLDTVQAALSRRYSLTRETESRLLVREKRP